MSQSDKAVIEAQVKAAWPGERVVPRRGIVFFPPVRDGGTTDLCIKMAAEIADKHYRKVIQDLMDSVGVGNFDLKAHEIEEWLDLE